MDISRRKVLAFSSRLGADNGGVKKSYETLGAKGIVSAGTEIKHHQEVRQVHMIMGIRSSIIREINYNYTTPDVHDHMLLTGHVYLCTS